MAARPSTNHIWTLPGLQGSLFRIDWAGEDCSHISGLPLRNMHSSGPDGIRWLTPHQGHELWVRGSYQVWSTTVLPVSPSRLSLPVQSVGGPACYSDYSVTRAWLITGLVPSIRIRVRTRAGAPAV